MVEAKSGVLGTNRRTSTIACVCTKCIAYYAMGFIISQVMLLFDVFSQVSFWVKQNSSTGEPRVL